MDFPTDLVVRAIAPILDRHGFGGPTSLGPTRRWGWKLDAVDVSGVLQGIVVNLYVWLPSKPAGGRRVEYESLAVVPLPQLVGQRQSWFSFTGKQPSRKVVSQVVRAIDAGMDWFGRFDTRRKCIEYLATQPRLREAPAGKDAERYLAGLPECFDLPCCSTTIPSGEIVL